jgi:putative cardiolipin synthase
MTLITAATRTAANKGNGPLCIPTHSRERPSRTKIHNACGDCVPIPVRPAVDPAAHRLRVLRLWLAPVVLLALGACVGLQPGAGYPKSPSVALAHPEVTKLGAKFDRLANEHAGASGFRILPVGVDGFLVRAQMIEGAERTLDLQYYIFRGDTTGRLLTDGLLRAADRGVRVRVLVDDADTVAGDEQLLALADHPQVEIRVFNPFSYRGHSRAHRVLEFLLFSARLNYRMHNKLMVADNSIAIVGGRNVGNQYFQMDPDSQFADDDVFAAGPIAAELSKTFDEYWNSPFAVPAQALGQRRKEHAQLANHRERAKSHPRKVTEPSPSGVDYVTSIASGEPYAGIMAGRLPLVWAAARVAYDTPDKKSVARGAMRGHLMTKPVAAALESVQTELLMITPYFVPAYDELHMVEALRSRQVRIGVLTNSLESTLDPLAFSGYMHYRLPLVASGVDLYEIRAQLGNTKGSGQTKALSRYGNYGLHAKLYVFDRRRLLIGSMNFDQRSKSLNTEIGVIIDSPELAEQVARRFEAMTQVQNAYHVVLRQGPGRGRLAWDTAENGAAVQYLVEPAPSAWRRYRVRLLSLLPLAPEL